MTETELSYYMGFMRSGLFGPVRLSLLMNSFPAFEPAWKSSRGELIKTGIDEHTLNVFFEKKKMIHPENELELLKKTKTLWCEKESANYPALLRQIPQAPKILFYRGVIGELSLPLALVGTRKVTSYGKEVTRTLARELAEHGCVIVSGLALGADTEAHQSSLEAGGKTLAVLGCGVDSETVYPRHNFFLSENIIESGSAVISEFPPRTPALKYNFPLRNRIIAGLTRGTCVTEAPEKSGALITARLALEYNRDVFAVPGNILQSTSDGCNKLIQLGAKAVTKTADILEEYIAVESRKSFDAAQDKQKNQDNLGDAEKKIFNLLPPEPIHIDAIIQMSGKRAEQVLTSLSILELEGHIKNLGNKTFVKSKI